MIVGRHTVVGFWIMLIYRNHMMEMNIVSQYAVCSPLRQQASVDDDGEPIVEANGAGGSNGAGKKGREGGAEGFGGRKGGKFMEGVPGVSHFTLQVGNVLLPLDISDDTFFLSSPSSQQSRGRFKEQLGGARVFLGLNQCQWTGRILASLQRNPTWCLGRQMAQGFAFAS